MHKKKIDEIKKSGNNLSYWKKVLISRDPKRPRSSDIIPLVFDEFTEIKGDRLTGDDSSVTGGFAKLDDTKIMLIAQEKSRTSGENNLTPKGVRKAIRLIKLAKKYNLPVITFIDNPGTFPGFESESSGLAFAISDILRELYEIETPTISVVIGEGGSGGAIAFAITDYILMMEYSTFMVIAPEAASVIIYNNNNFVEQIASEMKILATELLELNLIDGIIKEPAGGAHSDLIFTAENIKKELKNKLSCLIKTRKNKKIELREKKDTEIGLV